MQTCAARTVVVAQAGQAKATPKAAPVAVVRPLKAVGAGLASLALALSANAATVKVRACEGLGGSEGHHAYFASLAVRLMPHPLPRSLLPLCIAAGR